jgi:hypothetical protein
LALLISLQTKQLGVHIQHIEDEAGPLLQELFDTTATSCHVMCHERKLRPVPADIITPVQSFTNG